MAPAPVSARIDPDPLYDWLCEAAVLALPFEEVIGGTGDRACALGLPLMRAAFSVTMLHPQFESVSLVWRRDGGPVAGESHPHGASAEARFVSSPLRPLLDEAIARMTPYLAEGGRPDDLLVAHRYRLEAGDGVGDFAILRELQAEGATDYACFALPFGNDGEFAGWPRRGLLSSWATDRPGGFADGDLAALRRLQFPFAAAVRGTANARIARTVMRAYLGADAGMRVVRGEIRRGAAETLHAAILVADLRGFTALSDRLPCATVVAALDRYLEAMALPVEAHGGQVLKFLGDGLLATFATGGADGEGPGEGPGEGGGEARACRNAAAAAREAQDRVAALNARRAAAGEPTMALDVALHVGDVMYGNVGCDTRLDFTVIGPAVNEASRMEALCEPLGCSVVASDAFVRGLGGDAAAAFRCAGRHILRGIAEPRLLYVAAAPPA